MPEQTETLIKDSPKVEEVEKNASGSDSGSKQAHLSDLTYQNCSRRLAVFTNDSYDWLALSCFGFKTGTSIK
jgi:hypothetical protein